jgi:hypothetical protein
MNIEAIQRAGFFGRALNLLKFALAVSKTDCRWILALSESFGVMNSDPNRLQIVDAVATRTACRTAIETGTFLGETTRWLGERFDRVFTIEAQGGFANIAKLRLENNPKITVIRGNTAIEFPELMKKTNGPFFAYLDAHWGHDNPLCAELAALEKITNYVCMIDDFAVEGTDFGFDQYYGTRIDINLVARCAPWIKSIFVPNYSPQDAGKYQRGYCVFAVGQSGQFLESNYSELRLRRISVTV